MKEYVKCIECGKLFKFLTWGHLKQHNLTFKQYKVKYPGTTFVSENSLEKMKRFQREHNPMKGRKNPIRALLNKLQIGDKNPNYGKHRSKDIREKISKTKIRLFRGGIIKHPWIGKRHTKEAKEKNRISHLRENLSKETLEKMSKSHKGAKSPMKGLKLEAVFGKERAQTIRQKHSKTMEGRYLGNKNPRWNNGIKIVRGYIFIYKPEHPFNVQGYMQEHRLVIEKNIGRYLKPEEEIHHINGIKNDNRCENLMLLKNRGEHRKLHKGEISPNWKGGLSFEFYPKMFNKSLKENVKIKYNRTCQLCGVKENELKGYFKKLAIHHINYIKDDCSEKNLIPLCHNCNSKTSNGDRDYWTELISKKVTYKYQLQ